MGASKRDQRPDNRRLLGRRQTLAGLAGAPVALAAPAVVIASGRTPAQALGPFYPRTAQERPAATDADLLFVEGDRVRTRGTPLYLTGRVLAGGQPLANASVEIWQCDANAVYHHPAGGAVASRDAHFQGYGQTRCDGDGRFHFRTIRPVPYPGRTPHIHVRVESSRGTLATQLYLADEPGNARDVLYAHLTEPERRALSLRLVPTRAEHPLARATALMASVDLVLA